MFHLFVGLFFMLSWCVSVFCTYILPFIVILCVIYAINQSRNIDLGEKHVEVVKKYKAALDSLSNYKNLKTYKEIVNNIFKENVKLYKESLPFRKSYKKLTKVKEELKIELQKGVNGNNRIENTKNLLFKTTEKLEKLEKYINEVDEAIESTSIDFVNIKAELELKQVSLSSFTLPNVSIQSLKEKANTLTYLQKNLPVIND